MRLAGHGAGAMDAAPGWQQSIGVCTVGGGDQEDRLDLLV